MTDRLSAMDAAFISGETSAWHMHAGALILLDPAEAPDDFGVDTFRKLLSARLSSLGPFRRRLAPVPFGLDTPVWVTDATLDVDAHVRAVGVPSPGGPTELGRLAGDLFASKLDRSRPLWELWFIEGLADGRVALLAKVHHALVDGVGGARLYETLFDIEPDAPVRTTRRTGPFDRRARSERCRARGLGTLEADRHAGAGGPDGVAPCSQRRSPGAVPLFRGVVRRHPALPGAADLFQSRHNRAARSRVRRHPSRRRQGGEARPRRHGQRRSSGSVCRGLRRYLLERDELPDRPLVAQVPVAVAPDEGQSEEVGNHVAVMGAALPTHVSDPVAAVHEVAMTTRSAKSLQSALGDDVVMRLAESVPPGLVAAGVRSYTRLRLAEHHPPVFNLIVSNVRGPSMPLYAGGARLVGTYPMGPLLDGGGLNLTVLSSAESLHFGFLVCPDVVEDPWALARHTRDAFDELLAATREHAVTA
ncbi:MAG: WS/DGAT domain-containing protein [Acidimicrobiia bacterium]|nr:WS/DGAT domain-containing protein [Acidimicrobiia bacterium]